MFTAIQTLGLFDVVSWCVTLSYYANTCFINRLFSIGSLCPAFKKKPVRQIQIFMCQVYCTYDMLFKVKRLHKDWCLQTSKCNPWKSSLTSFLLFSYLFFWIGCSGSGITNANCIVGVKEVCNIVWGSLILLSSSGFLSLYALAKSGHSLLKSGNLSSHLWKLVCLHGLC